MSAPPESQAGGAPLLSVLARYPQISETFVEGELRELVARGVPVEVVALAPGHPDPERPPGGPRGLPLRPLRT